LRAENSRLIALLEIARHRVACAGAAIPAARRGPEATPIRRDGQQPIIFMRCGPIRRTTATPAGAPRDLEVLPRSRHARIDLPQDARIQDVFRHLANDQA
jgi:hypothetical protein